MRQRNIPFGYKMERGEIVVHPNEADIVRQIYSSYIDGNGYFKITQILNQGSIQYRPGVMWNKHMVKRILESRRYIGEYGFPAVITVLEFEEVVASKAGNPQCVARQRMQNEIQSVQQMNFSYMPSPAVLRMTNEINRALERTADPEHVRQLIFDCAAEKYNSIGGVSNG